MGSIQRGLSPCSGATSPKGERNESPPAVRPFIFQTRAAATETMGKLPARVFGLATRPRAFAALLGAREARRGGSSREDWGQHREFLLNKRDTPLLGIPEEAASEGLPVLSQYTSSAFLDLPLPAVVDYRRALAGLWVGRDELPVPPREPPLAWDHRIAAAVFRGGATGAGVTAEENMRLRLCATSLAWKRSRRHEPPLLDARLTSWNPRHKWCADGVIRVIDPCRAASPLTPRSGASERYRLTMREQAAWKFYVLVDGNVGASRLGELAEFQFTVLWVRTSLPQVAHAWRGMRPWRHYVPIKTDLSDLEAQLLWCRQNDKAAHEISLALHALLAPHLTKEGIEAEVAETLAHLPPPLPTSQFCASMWRAWFTRRSAIYVLICPRGHLLSFEPFANQGFRNAWSSLQFDPPGQAAFLARAQALWPSPARVLTDSSRWWENGALVCNVLPRGVWGEAMLIELHALLTAAARRWAVSQCGRTADTRVSCSSKGSVAPAAVVLAPHTADGPLTAAELRLGGDGGIPGRPACAGDFPQAAPLSHLGGGAGLLASSLAEDESGLGRDTGATGREEAEMAPRAPPWRRTSCQDTRQKTPRRQAIWPEGRARSGRGHKPPERKAYRS